MNDVKAALEKTGETFGRIDFAFNNAGAEQPITATADLTTRLMGVRPYRGPAKVASRCGGPNA